MNLSTNPSTNPFFTHGIEKLCRICQVMLKDADSTHSIFSTLEELESPMSVLQVLQSFSNCNFYNGPQMVCKWCYDKTVEVYKFIQICNKADENMQHYLKDVEAMKTIKNEMDVDVKVEEISIEREFIEETENEKISKFDEFGMVISGTQIKIEHRILKEGLEEEEIKTIKDEPDVDVKFEEIFIAPTRFIIDGREFVEGIENGKISKFDTSNNEESTISHTEIITVENENTYSSDFDNLRVEVIDEQMHDEQMGLNVSKDCHLVCSDKKELDDCGKVFATKSSLNTDIHVHTGEKPFICLICKRDFAAPTFLRRHMDSHNKVKEHKCEQCDRQFTQAVHLRTHMDIHKGVKPHKCEQCDRRFTDPSALRRHMQMHNGIKPHKCVLCDRRFTQAGHLRTHMNIHKGVKAHKCEQCDRRFARPSDLRRHMMTHFEVKAHKCEQCDRRFNRAENLRSHMDSHNGVKAYKCEQCDRRFTRAAYLRVHMDIHNRVKAHKC